MVMCFERRLRADRTRLAARCAWLLLGCSVLLCTAEHAVRPACARAQAATARATSEQRAPDSAAPALAGAFRVVVLRASEGEALADVSQLVDAAMLRDLATIAGIERPTVSPIDYAEIALTVGCSDLGRACLVAIAQMLQVEAVVVRRLSADAARVRLSLVYVDPRSEAEPVVAEREVSRPDASTALPSAVPVLVRALFGIPEPVTPAPAQSPATTSGADGSGSPDIGVWTWVTIAAGAGTLVAGLAMGASAASEFDNYKALPVRTTAEAERADRRFDTVESKAAIANVLMPVGGALLAAGGVLLVLDLTREPERPALALRPVRGGAMLDLHIGFGGP